MVLAGENALDVNGIELQLSKGTSVTPLAHGGGYIPLLTIFGCLQGCFLMHVDL